MSIETHIIADEDTLLPGEQYTRLVVAPAEVEGYVALVYVRDGVGYEAGVNLDQEDADRLIAALRAEIAAKTGKTIW